MADGGTTKREFCGGIRYRAISVDEMVEALLPSTGDGLSPAAKVTLTIMAGKEENG